MDGVTVEQEQDLVLVELEELKDLWFRKSPTTVISLLDTLKNGLQLIRAGMKGKRGISHLALVIKTEFFLLFERYLNDINYQIQFNSYTI